MSGNLLVNFGAGWQGFSAQGVVLNGGSLTTYLAGSVSTAQATYTDSTLGTPNANPIVLGSDGRPPQEIWVPSGVALKIVLKDSGGSTLGTWDNIPGIAPNVIPENAQSGTTYTLALTDNGSWVSLTNSGAITLTVPKNSTIPFAAGTIIMLRQGGSGQVTVSPASGVTLHNLNSQTKLQAQYAVAFLRQTSTIDTWELVGNTSA